MKEAVRKFLEVMIKEAAGSPIKVESVSITGENDIDKGVDEIMAYDDFLDVVCKEKKMWFNIYTGNEPDELIVDYTDNEICNKVYNEFQASL